MARLSRRSEMNRMSVGLCQLLALARSKQICEVRFMEKKQMSREDIMDKRNWAAGYVDKQALFCRTAAEQEQDIGQARDDRDSAEEFFKLARKLRTRARLTNLELYDVLWIIQEEHRGTECGNDEGGKFPPEIKKELDDLVKHFDEITTSDLQGVVMAMAMKNPRLDADEMLEYIYKKRG